MTLIGSILQEFDHEAATTRNLLERVPDDKLDWTPHPKSRTLGQLALHIAAVPGAIASLATSASPASMPQPQEPRPASTADVLAAHDESSATVHRALDGISDATLMETLRVMAFGREIMALPRVAMIRTVMLNHWYHHRGQLTVYLRELDVPLPSIYGPTADENPFAAPDAD
jgi:uncharacterized damage-inducible protein DinB